MLDIGRHAYRISDCQCKFVATIPSLDPELWNAYLEGALRSYRKYGVEDALELETICDGASTSLFFVAVDGEGEGDVVAGLRVQGPYESAEGSHAVREWAGRPGEAEVRKLITDRVPFGVVEVKGAWVSESYPDRSLLTQAIARVGPQVMSILGVQFIMATAGSDHILSQWASAGGVIASGIPSAPYPSERYHAQLMWWDQLTFLRHADPAQVEKMLDEMIDLAQTVQWHAGHRRVRSGTL